jgi:hypothetical protein
VVLGNGYWVLGAGFGHFGWVPTGAGYWYWGWVLGTWLTIKAHSIQYLLCLKRPEVRLIHLIAPYRRKRERTIN